MMAALPIVSRAAKKAGVWFGCYPNSSEKLPDGSWNLRASNNKLMASCALDWMKVGAVMVGSCCHSTPRTTSLIENKRNLFYVLKEEIYLAEDDDIDLPDHMLW
jgi:S-methylmethionine-dependent homocysteine/selenocysteine methylase